MLDCRSYADWPLSWKRSNWFKIIFQRWVGGEGTSRRRFLSAGIPDFDDEYFNFQNWLWYSALADNKQSSSVTSEDPNRCESASRAGGTSNVTTWYRKNRSDLFWNFWKIQFQWPHYYVIWGAAIADAKGSYLKLECIYRCKRMRAPCGGLGMPSWRSVVRVDIPDFDGEQFPLPAARMESLKGDWTLCNIERSSLTLEDPTSFENFPREEWRNN